MAVIKRRNHMNIPPQSMMKEVVEDEKASMKQGIVTILRTDDLADKTPPPIRRTLSADMSSKRWLAQNGFSSQATLKSNHGQANESKNPSWGCNNNDHVKSCPIPLLPPPYYVPRPTERSSITLSEKSLELCTESLGSENGSDSFLTFSYPNFEEYYSLCLHGDDDHQEREEILSREDDQFRGSISYENLRVVKYKNAPAVGPFPPPIRSVTSDGDSLRVQSRRESGRLVLEAMSAPPKNYLHAQRGDGRLVLTLIRRRKAASKDRALEENEEIKGGLEEEGGKNDVVGPEVRSQLLSHNGMVRVQAMNSLTSHGKKNPTFMIGEKVGISEGERDNNRRIQTITQSLPSPRASMMIPQTPPCGAAYEHYFWRNKTTMVKNCNTSNDDRIYVAKQYYMNQGLVVTTTKAARGGKLEPFVPFSKGCKEPKRSLMIWKPYYIATS